MVAAHAGMDQSLRLIDQPTTDLSPATCSSRPSSGSLERPLDSVATVLASRVTILATLGGMTDDNDEFVDDERTYALSSCASGNHDMCVHIVGDAPFLLPTGAD